eukprot:5030043-Amphidinium_carterae.1
MWASSSHDIEHFGGARATLCLVQKLESVIPCTGCTTTPNNEYGIDKRGCNMRDLHLTGSVSERIGALLVNRHLKVVVERWTSRKFT